MPINRGRDLWVKKHFVKFVLIRLSLFIPRVDNRLKIIDKLSRLETILEWHPKTTARLGQLSITWLGNKILRNIYAPGTKNKRPFPLIIHFKLNLVWSSLLLMMINNNMIEFVSERPFASRELFSWKNLMEVRYNLKN